MIDQQVENKQMISVIGTDGKPHRPVYGKEEKEEAILNSIEMFYQKEIDKLELSDIDKLTIKVTSEPVGTLKFSEGGYKNFQTYEMTFMNVYEVLNHLQTNLNKGRKTLVLYCDTTGELSIPNYLGYDKLHIENLNPFICSLLSESFYDMLSQRNLKASFRLCMV